MKSKENKNHMNMRKTILFILLSIISLGLSADTLDSLQAVLRDKPQIQEKVYLHLDNNCYFVGDTLWYKAYVVQADCLKPTRMSKLLYVELLSPDGFVVERQHVILAGNGTTYGQFALPDSLYSGYYEVRAYTKWQLNFNVEHRNYTFIDERRFYNKQMCADYFRDFEGLYSRVVPIYNKPKTPGDYAQRYISKRPRQNVAKEHPRLSVTFFPEGGECVKGIQGRIAFEVKDHNGQLIDIEGTLSDGTRISTTHLGKGTFLFTPSNQDAKATFTWNNKEWTFRLPKPTDGCALAFDPEKRIVSVKSGGAVPSALAVLCRGRLQHFQRLKGSESVNLNALPKPLPTGINEIIIYDADANPVASRLFFVNNHDFGKPVKVSLTSADAEIGDKSTLQPYAKVDMKLESDMKTNGIISVAVRDTQTDDPAYDDGNMMTEMLLSSELKGFVPMPGYYFAADDEVHRRNLDLLMMVQGWRRYKRVAQFRYLPEKTTTFEGTVYKLLSTASILEIDDLAGMMQSTNVAEEALAKIEGLTETSTLKEDTEDDGTGISTEVTEENVEYAVAEYEEGRVQNRQVCVEAEVSKDGDTAGVVVRTDRKGRFSFQLPPYYDDAVLFVKAYNPKDSVDKCMASTKDKGWRDERSIPDYFVKRDMFFPIFSQPYSWYQVNSPEIQFVDVEDDENIPETSKLAGNHTLQTVYVKAKRRGKRAIDFTKPAMVCDTYRLYNDVTDYGLSMGVFNAATFPYQVCTYLFGNMGRVNRGMNVRAMVEKSTFYRNYPPTVTEFDKPMSSAKMFDFLHLNRMNEVRVFTDYELRTDSFDVSAANSADVTLDFVPLPDEGKRYTYRDRRYIFPGIAYTEEYYNPDYSTAIPQTPTDYRRTLYWNPNVKLDKNGTFTTTFYNNCRETRVKVSLSGLDAEGQTYVLGK